MTLSDPFLSHSHPTLRRAGVSPGGVCPVLAPGLLLDPLSSLTGDPGWPHGARAHCTLESVCCVLPASLPCHVLVRLLTWGHVTKTVTGQVCTRVEGVWNSDDLRRAFCL